jgi:hypothetical protein
LRLIVLVKLTLCAERWDGPKLSDYVYALVSGYPSLERGLRLAMILQAVIDDSRTRKSRRPRIFMLGGLMASFDSWAQFSDEWDAACRKPPGIAYFKLSQALSLKDEFAKTKGWTEDLRDERVARLVAIAKRHALCGVNVSLNETLYEEFVKGFTPFEELRDPYFLCFYQLVDAVTSARELLPPSKELDYIFDEQGPVGLKAVEWWDKLNLVAEWRDNRPLGSTPVHRDEKKFRPLQAADLWAGLARIRLEQWGNVFPTARKMMQGFDGLRYLEREYSRDDLLDIGADVLLRGARRKLGRRRDREG